MWFILILFALVALGAFAVGIEYCAEWYDWVVVGAIVIIPFTVGIIGYLRDRGGGDIYPFGPQ